MNTRDRMVLAGGVVLIGVVALGLGLLLGLARPAAVVVVVAGPQPDPLVQLADITVLNAWEQDGDHYILADRGWWLMRDGLPSDDRAALVVGHTYRVRLCQDTQPDTRWVVVACLAAYPGRTVHDPE